MYKKIRMLLICALLLSFVQIQEVSAKTFHWSYKRDETSGSMTTEPNYLQMLERTGSIFVGNQQEKELYLTFDNGYENGYTDEILTILAEKEVPATFFITGHYIKTAPELVERMVAEGHIVGNHSWSHPSLPNVDDGRLIEELDRVKKAFNELTGEKDMNYLRPPRGEFNERSLALAEKIGYVNVFWTMAYKDWEVDKQRGKDYAYTEIMKRIHPGAVMLIHSVSKDNKEALPQVIDDARAEGYVFKSLDDLILKKEIGEFPF